MLEKKFSKLHNSMSKLFFFSQTYFSPIFFLYVLLRLKRKIFKMSFVVYI